MNQMTIDAERTESVKLVAVLATAIASLFYFYEFFIRLMPQAMVNHLMLTFSIGNTGLGILGGCFFWGYAPMQIPAGLILDRIGAKRALTLAMALCTLGTFMFALTNNFYIACVSRFLVGVTAAFAYPGTLLLAAKSFSARNFAGITGLIQTSGCAGAIVGVAPVAIAVNHLGWQNTVYIAGTIGLLLTVLFWATSQKQPSTDPHTEHTNLKERLKEVCHKHQTWAIAVFAFSVWAPISVFATFWCVPFLKTHGFTDGNAGLFDALIWLGIAFGGPFLGWLSNRVGKRKPVLALSSTAALISSLFIVYMPTLNTMLLAMALFVFGAAASGQAVSFGFVQDINPLKAQGTAFGLNNMAIVAGGVLLTPVVGYLLDVTAHWPMAKSYELALAVLPLCSLLGLITIIVGLKETNCLSQTET